MKRITTQQITKIKDIINNHMTVLMKLMVGDGMPSADIAKKLGIPKNVADLISTSYKFGKLKAISDKDLAKMSPSEIDNLISKLKLTPSQQYSIEQSKLKAQQYIDNLQQRITSNVVSSALQSDLLMWQALQKEIPNAVKNNTPRYKVIQELRDSTTDMNRDWHRVATTEMWSAKCQGETEAIMNGESPMSSKKGDTKVYIRPAPNACSKCKQLYLESDGVTPKVFTMSQLLSNGSNNGKKQADWLPCVPPLHPNCTCVLNVMPDDTKFDENGNLVFSPK